LQWRAQWVPVYATEMRFEQFAQRKLTIPGCVDEFSKLLDEQVETIRLEILASQWVIRRKPPRKIAKRLPHLRQRHAVLAPNRSQRMGLYKIEEGHEERVARPNLDHRSEESRSRSGWVCWADQPRPQRGGRKVQVPSRIRNPVCRKISRVVELGMPSFLLHGRQG